MSYMENCGTPYLLSGLKCNNQVQVHEKVRCKDDIFASWRSDGPKVKVRPRSCVKIVICYEMPFGRDTCLATSNTVLDMEWVIWEVGTFALKWFQLLPNYFGLVIVIIVVIIALILVTPTQWLIECRCPYYHGLVIGHMGKLWPNNWTLPTVQGQGSTKIRVLPPNVNVVDGTECCAILTNVFGLLILLLLVLLLHCCSLMVFGLHNYATFLKIMWRHICDCVQNLTSEINGWHFCHLLVSCATQI